MKIVIEVRETKDSMGKRAVGVTTYWKRGSKPDPLRIVNCGNEIYNCVKEAFESGFSGGVFKFEGERK